ncbi:MAG: hypothetical protein LBQ49_01075 [Rickettsiales bacterium]|jgi:hypothetical protein|nr:hypothetical protein [Rickettsiales bacterium]
MEKVIRKTDSLKVVERRTYDLVDVEKGQIISKGVECKKEILKLFKEWKQSKSYSKDQIAKIAKEK